jgi:nucleotide-binding universal stress UspA family protein
VGVDGSDESLSAADWAAREALRRSLPVRLVHGWEWQPSAEPSLPPGDPQHHWAQRVLSGAAETLMARYPGLEVSTEASDETAVPALLEACGEAELLVLGSRGLAGLAGFLIGSVGLSVIARTGLPVVMVRAEATEDKEHLPDTAGRPSTATGFRDVVLGLDVDHPCEPVIRFAFEAAVLRRAPLRVVHTWNFPAAYRYMAGVMTPEIMAELETRAKWGVTAALTPWRERFPDVKVEEQVELGPAPEHLVRTAADACLLVVGRRTRRPSVGTRIGPVAHAALHHAGCPVAVVPHD